MNYPEMFSQEVVAALGAEFSAEEVEFLPRAASGGMALGLPYIDARDVMRRLDAVVGPHNWQFDFDVLSPDGKMVRGKLTVLGATKCDAGEASQEDEPLKSAVSDALKRCAVHFGVGRYLYYLPRVWAPFDPQKRRFIEQPRLDPAAVRRALALCGVQAAAPSAARELIESRGDARSTRGEGKGAAKAEASAPRTEAAPAAATPAPARAETAAPKAAADTVKDVVTEPVQVASATEAGPEAAAPRPTVVQGGASTTRSGNGAGNGGRRSPWAAGVTATDRVSEREGSPEASGNAPDSAGDQAASAALSCARQECGRPITRGQHDVSVRSFGKAYCPACQKLQARAA
jgi:hypothetical protein